MNNGIVLVSGCALAVLHLGVYREDRGQGPRDAGRALDGRQHNRAGRVLLARDQAAGWISSSWSSMMSRASSRKRGPTAGASASQSSSMTASIRVKAATMVNAGHRRGALDHAAAPRHQDPRGRRDHARYRFPAKLVLIRRYAVECDLHAGDRFAPRRAAIGICNFITLDWASDRWNHAGRRHLHRPPRRACPTFGPRSTSLHCNCIDPSTTLAWA